MNFQVISSLKSTVCKEFNNNGIFVNKLHKQLMGKTKRHNNIYTNISNLFSYLRLQVALDGIIID